MQWIRDGDASKCRLYPSDFTRQLTLNQKRDVHNAPFVVKSVPPLFSVSSFVHCLELKNFSFLGGLSLHLNHLIASCAANYDWPFGTLPFGLFCSNLDTRDLETYPRTYCGHFWNMSLFDDSRAVWILFRKWVVSKNCILLRNGWPIPGYSDLVLGGEVPRLSHGPICFPIQNT